MKNTPTLSTFHSWQYTCWQVSFSRHSLYPNPPIGPSHGIAWFITSNHTFPVVHCPVWRRSLHDFRRRLAFTGKMFDLWAAARPWNLIPLNFRRTVMVLAGQFVALWNSRMIVSLDVWWVSQTTFFNALRSLWFIKRGLPRRGCTFTFPTSHSHHQPWLGQLEKGCNLPDRFLTDVATNN
jgi:hypothetical protein